MESTNSSSSEEVSENKHWTEKIEESAINFRNGCLVYKWCHNKMAAKNSIWNKILENSVTVMGIVVTTGIFTSAFYCSTTFELQIVTSVISAVSTILDRIHSNLALEASSEDHKRMSLRWGELHNNIDLQLRLAAKERNEAVFYMEWIQKMYTNLLEMSPDIDSGVWETYKKQFPDTLQNSILTISSEIERGAKDTPTSSGGSESEKKHKKTKNKTERSVQYESDRMKYEIDRFLQDGIL